MAYKETHPEQTGEPTEVLTTTEARQGFRGRRVLKILLTSLALAAVAGLFAMLLMPMWNP